MEKEKIYRNLTENIGLENFKKIDKRNTKIKNALQKTLTLSICALSVTGMVFARDISTKIYDNVYGGGYGYGKAIEEGYIEKTDMEDEVSVSTIENEETGEIVEDLGTKIKVEEFLMDDFSLSATLDITLSDEIKDIVKIEDIWNVSFPDLVVYDEDYNVLRLGYGKKYEEFCKEKNTEPNEEEKWFGSGENGPLVMDKTGNHLKVMFNIYIGGPYYPKSKQINFELTKIRISNKVETMQGDEQLVLKGDWKFSVDVPEKMYSRTSVKYTQKSTTNSKFKLTNATVYDAGMNISLEFQGEKLPESPTSPELEFYNSLPQDDELRNGEIDSYLRNELWQTEEYYNYIQQIMDQDKFEKYVVNSKGEKFEQTINNQENGNTSTDENGYVKFTGMFDLTKYDMTDAITLYVDYNGEKAEIVLEKVGEE